MTDDYVQILLKSMVMHTKFSANVMVLGVMRNEGNVMSPHIFSWGLRINVTGYDGIIGKL